MYTSKPRKFEGHGLTSRRHEIANTERYLEALAATEREHAANPAMDVVDLLSGLPGFYLFGVRHGFDRAAKEIEELGFPQIAAMIAEQRDAITRMEKVLNDARDLAHQAYGGRQAQLILGHLPKPAIRWLKEIEWRPAGRYRADSLSERAIDTMIQHHLIERRGPVGWYGLLYLGKDVRELLLKGKKAA